MFLVSEMYDQLIIVLLLLLSTILFYSTIQSTTNAVLLLYWHPRFQGATGIFKVGYYDSEIKSDANRVGTRFKMREVLTF